MPKVSIGSVAAFNNKGEQFTVTVFKDGSTYILVRDSDGHEELAHPSVKSADDVPCEVNIKFFAKNGVWLEGPHT